MNRLSENEIEGKSKTLTLRVITIDDSPIMIQRIESLLKNIDNVAFLGNAINVTEAFRLAAITNPNVIIMDILRKDKTTEVNGIQLLSTLRNQYPESKIIMLTNLTESLYKRACNSAGADYFLDKSNEFEKIQHILEKTSDKR